MNERSWLRRGEVSPAPWGETIPAVMLDYAVTFLRGHPVKDGSGTWTMSPLAPYLTADAAVDDTEAGTVDRMDSTTGATYRHTLRAFRIFIRRPADPARYPKKDDEVSWTDAAGRHYRLKVTSVRVDYPAEGFEVQTQGYE